MTKTYVNRPSYNNFLSGKHIFFYYIQFTVLFIWLGGVTLK